MQILKLQNIEAMGTCIMGTKITPKVLYGVPLKELASTNVTKKDIEKDKYGATSQAKSIDNRIVYSLTNDGSNRSVT